MSNFIVKFMYEDKEYNKFAFDSIGDSLSIQTNEELGIDKIISLYFSVPSSEGFIVNDPNSDEKVFLEYRVDSKDKSKSSFRNQYGLTAVFDFDDVKKKIMYDYLLDERATQFGLIYERVRAEFGFIGI